MRGWSFDVKTIHGGSDCYQSARAAEQQSGAVQERAYRVIGEVRRHAERLDRELHPPGDTRIALREAALGPTRGLVFGQYGEASADVHALIELTARREAERRWRRHGARTLAEAVSALTADVRRHVGIVAVREMARHRLRRVQWVGVPRSAVEARPRRGQIGAAVGGVVGAGPRYHAQPEEEAFYAHLPRGGGGGGGPAGPPSPMGG